MIFIKNINCSKKISNGEFKQVYIQNNKKNFVRTAAVQDAAGSHQCNECHSGVDKKVEFEYLSKDELLEIN